MDGRVNKTDLSAQTTVAAGNSDILQYLMKFHDTISHFIKFNWSLRIV